MEQSGLWRDKGGAEAHSKAIMEVTVHDKQFEVFITRERIAERVKELGAQISEHYRGLNPLIIGILNGSFIFAADLFRELTIEAGISFIKLVSYKGTTSTGNVITAIGLEENLHDRHIIILEDIIDTGRTMSAFLPEIMLRHPASVKIATFLAKPEALQFAIKADYVGFEIENKFVVGYGLDYNGLGRNYADLYQLKE
jgi:hypoxanthine phosphoribosyltransferase